MRKTTLLALLAFALVALPALTASATDTAPEAATATATLDVLLGSGQLAHTPLPDLGAVRMAQELCPNNAPTCLRHGSCDAYCGHPVAYGVCELVPKENYGCCTCIPL